MSNPELTGRPSSLDRKARSLVRATASTTPRRHTAATKLAQGLGWFSIGLGVVEVLAARRVARAVGLQGREPIVRAFGLREIANGVGILASRQARSRSAGVWSRVAGDALDLSALGMAAAAGRHASRGRPVAAMAAIASITMLDLACARALQQEANAARQTTDYSGRSGIRLPTAKARRTEPDRTDESAQEAGMAVHTAS